MKPPFTIVGLGEILWDVLPSGKQLGGAPSNFAYMASLLGDRGVVASRIGNDALGQETLNRMAGSPVDSGHLQRDAAHPTGTAQAPLDAGGQPKFTITENVAWDFLEWSADWKDLADSADAVCFGTLAQRSPVSRQTILRFVRALPSHALRIFDVNLRQNYFSREILRESLKLSDVAKLSHEELPAVAELLGLPAAGDEPSARQLVEKFSLKLVCITRGKHGSLLVTEKESAEHPGFQVTVADTVGAGDAFTACLTHHYLRDCTLAGINEQANRFAAWVASCPGGTPSLAGRELSEVLKLIGQNKSAPANPARADSQI